MHVADSVSIDYSTFNDGRDDVSGAPFSIVSCEGIHDSVFRDVYFSGVGGPGTSGVSGAFIGASEFACICHRAADEYDFCFSYRKDGCSQPAVWLSGSSYIDSPMPAAVSVVLSHEVCV